MGIHILAVASPGPAFVATLRISMQQRRPVAISHALGIGTAAMVWATSAVFGVQIILSKAAWLYRAMEFCGGAYLLYIGVQSWRHAHSVVPGEDSGPLASQLSLAGAFLRGFSTNLSNPKVIVFFASIFAAVLNPAWPNWLRGIVLFVIFLDETGYYVALTLLLSTQKAQAAYRQGKVMIERTAGAAMCGFGGKLLYSAVRR